MLSQTVVSHSPCNARQVGRNCRPTSSRLQCISALRRTQHQWRIQASDSDPPPSSSDADTARTTGRSNNEDSKERPVKLRKKPTLPPRWQPPSQTTILASLLAYSGVVGSVAVALATFLHLDPFGSFHLDQNDIARALMMATPVYLLTAIIMLPDWSHWNLPTLDQVLGSTAPNFKGPKEDAERAARSSQAQTEAPSTTATPASTSTDTTSSPAQTDEPWLTNSAASKADATTSQPSTNSTEQSDIDTTSSSKRNSFAMDGPIIGQTPSPWRPQETAGRTNMQKQLAIFKDAMHLAQGYYIGNNPSKGLSVALEATIILVESLSGEMLYRAVAVTWVSGWIKDRLYEAGVDDDIILANGSSLTATDAAKWASVLAFGLLGVGLTVRKIAKSRRRTSMMLQVTEIVQDSNGAGAKKKPKGKKSLRDALGSASTAMDYSTYIQGLRDLLQLLALNSAYVVTGNLAASYTAAVVNQVVISALQRYAQERLRKRSEAISEHLEKLNEQLRVIAAKQAKEEPSSSAAAADPSSVAAAEEATPVQQLAAEARSSTPAVPPAGSVASDSSTGAAAAATVEEEEAAPADSLQRTITSLDQLLGELVAPPSSGAGAK